MQEGINLEQLKAEIKKELCEEIRAEMTEWKKMDEKAATKVALEEKTSNGGALDGEATRVTLDEKASSGRTFDGRILTGDALDEKTSNGKAWSGRTLTHNMLEEKAVGKRKKDQKVWNPLIKIMMIEIGSLLTGFLILFFVIGGNPGLHQWMFERYIDITIPILLLVLTMPVLIGSGLWKDFVKIFSLYQPECNWKLHELKRSQNAIEVLQKQLLYAAVMIVLFQCIDMLYNMSDIATLGPRLSVIFMTGLYTAILELLLLPIRSEVKKRITDFMEEA